MRLEIIGGNHELFIWLKRERGSIYSFIETARRNNAINVITTKATGKKNHHHIPAVMAVC